MVWTHVTNLKNQTHSCNSKVQYSTRNICGSFTKQGDGAGQIFSLVSTPVQLYQPLHQVTIATPAVTNLTRITHTPERGGGEGGLMKLQYTTHIHSN